MTKSQNTKNEQQKDLCITSEQLTDGYHYAIVFDKERIIEKKKDLPIPYCEGFCCQNYQYLAPVPSYEEYAMTQDCVKRLFEAAEKETILKELLKDCRLAIYDYPPYDLASDKIRLMNKIDEVLK